MSRRVLKASATSEKNLWESFWDAESRPEKTGPIHHTTQFSGSGLCRRRFREQFERSLALQRGLNPPGSYGFLIEE